MQKKAKKTIAAAVAVLSASFLVLGTTLAWQSTNQVAKNQKFTATNPGARLHDDYNGTNKDVYVENFGENDLAVRVQIREFLEYGADAGKETGEKRIPIDSGARFKNPDNWPVHVPTADDVSKCSNFFHNYVQYKFGGQTTFIPTFNKNKDSLAPDINGTFEGTDPDDDKHFDDYKSPESLTAVTDSEVYDADDNSVDEGNGGMGGKGGKIDVNYTLRENQKHEPQVTINSADVISMDTWLKSEDSGGKGGKPGDFWVYDKDGWAYWANPLKKGTATALLLTEANLQTKPDDDYFYAIDIVCQAASIGDLGENYKDGFWDPLKGSAPTQNAQKLLKAIGGTSVPISIKDQIKDAMQNADHLDANKHLTIDGEKFYAVGVTDDNKALLIQKTPSNSMYFNKNYSSDPNWNQWKDSDVKNYLNGEYLNTHPTIARLAENSTIKTRSNGANEDWYETTQQVFLITEADFLGTVMGSQAQNANDYTLGKVQKLNIPMESSNYYSFSRTPYNNNQIVTLYESSYNYTNDNGGTSRYIRPAFFVDIS